MRIDATRYRMFRNNPELYRLYQCLGYKPKDESPAILLGTAGHAFMDGDARGREFSAVARELREQPGMPVELVATAEVLAKRLLEDYPSESALLSEREFVYQIPGSPHQMVGKIDRVEGFIQPASQFPKRAKEENWRILDWKFKQNPNGRSYYEADKRVDVQAGFYLRGATTWGYKTDEFTYVAAIKSAPIEIWPIPVPKDVWTEERLQRLERYVHIACEQIEWMIRTFGIEEPWPHKTDSFPCNKDARYCSYKNICETTHKPGEFPVGFEPRPDHLEIMREENNATNQ